RDRGGEAIELAGPRGGERGRQGRGRAVKEILADQDRGEQPRSVGLEGAHEDGPAAAFFAQALHVDAPEREERRLGPGEESRAKNRDGQTDDEQNGDVRGHGGPFRQRRVYRGRV